ncbi:MAG: addiction module protein [Planctomycetota bacterium]|nr:MAG: addiction module protein [Planctomycetota bacterium]
MNYKPALLPLSIEKNLENNLVLKKTISAHRYLAELKGIVSTIPNETILINTLSLQEAKDSSAIENIVTTHDEIFKRELFTEKVSAEAKEVKNYATALQHGFKLIKINKIIRLNDILEIQELLENNKAGLRKIPGTALKNQQTGATVYTPPQDGKEVAKLIGNLLEYINDDEISELDPLVKMAIIHFQFESIHPFYDGNGRTGRILNILYLVLQDLLELPVLYLSNHIIKHKAAYYKLLQTVREKNDWQSWILFILDGIEKTAQDNILLIKSITELMQNHKQLIRNDLPKIYSQDLINSLFKHPYTKVQFFINDLNVSRITATKYLNLLTEKKLLQKHKVGKNNYYINSQLCDLFLSK